MIKSFRCKETEKIFSREYSKKFHKEIQEKAYRKLLILEAAEKLDDLKVPPGNQLESLSGDRKGKYSIRINDKWRICFKWQKDDAYEVEIIDYH